MHATWDLGIDKAKSTKESMNQQKNWSIESRFAASIWLKSFGFHHYVKVLLSLILWNKLMLFLGLLLYFTRVLGKITLKWVHISKAKVWWTVGSQNKFKKCYFYSVFSHKSHDSRTPFFRLGMEDSLCALKCWHSSWNSHWLWLLLIDAVMPGKSSTVKRIQFIASSLSALVSMETRHCCVWISYIHKQSSVNLSHSLVPLLLLMTKAINCPQEIIGSVSVWLHCDALPSFVWSWNCSQTNFVPLLQLNG